MPVAEPVPRPAQLVVYPKPEQILTRDEQSAGWGIRVDENNLIHYKNGITGDVCCPSSAVSLPPSHSIENTFYREHILLRTHSIENTFYGTIVCVVAFIGLATFSLLRCLIGGGATLETFLTLHLCCARC